MDSEGDSGTDCITSGIDSIAEISICVPLRNYCQVRFHGILNSMYSAVDHKVTKPGLTSVDASNSIKPITLIDWLYTPDFNGSEKSGALILFPRMVDRWNVSSLIVSKWEDYMVVVVTDHPNEFMSTTLDLSTSTRWTDLELVPFPLIKYSDLAEINRALHNTEIDIVLFDDARMLATIAPALNFTSVQPKVIVLSTWGDTMRHLDIVTANLPDLRLLKVDLISDTADVEWTVSKVQMSNRQLNFYDQVRKREIDDDATTGQQHKVPYPISRMVTLYAYPDAIMADTLAHKAICETDQTSLPDKLDMPNSWLNTSYLESLSENGPKLTSVLDGVVSNWPEKQIVLTRFNHRYGVDLISSFLQLLTRNKLNPYELSEIFSVSCTDEYETTLNNLHKFNTSEAGVLVTNIVPLVALTKVSIIHVADSYSPHTLKMVIDRCHKRYLNASGSTFTVYSHIATHPSEKSSDEALYETLVQDIVDTNRLYSGLIASSGRIVFKPDVGLLVV